MTQSSVTKKGLVISTCTLLLSVLMMAGSTFAWFTDSVSTGSNRITTGDLKVELLHTGADVAEPEAVKQSTLLFTDKDGKAVNWEPGKAAYENLTVKNNGSLALEYRLALDLNDANTIAGTDKSLSDVLKVKVVKGEVTADDITENKLKNASGFNAVTDGRISIPESAGDESQQTLQAEKSGSTYGVILYWQPDPDKDYEYNLANYPDKDEDGEPVDRTSDGSSQLTVNLGISLGATQAMEETDSRDSSYDRDAVYPAGNASELKAAVSKASDGDTIELSGNISLDEVFTVDKDISLKSVGGAVISGAALQIGSKNDVTLEDITFKAPRTSDNRGVSLKASGYSGKLVLKGCSFNAPQWSCIEIDTASKASLNITDCSFAVAEASVSAGHKCDAAGESSKLAAGAHRVMDIDGNENTVLVITGSSFRGLGSCDASAAVSISGISADNMKFEENTADDTGRISTGQNGGLNGFSKK